MVSKIRCCGAVGLETIAIGCACSPNCTDGAQQQDADKCDYLVDHSEKIRVELVRCEYMDLRQRKESQSKQMFGFVLYKGDSAAMKAELLG